MIIRNATTDAVILDFTDAIQLNDVTTTYFDSKASQYRRGDKALVGNNGPGYKARFHVEFQRLTASQVSTLESLRRARDPFVVVIDGTRYTVIWTGNPKRSDSIETNWSLGESIQAEFRQV